MFHHKIVHHKIVHPILSGFSAPLYKKKKKERTERTQKKKKKKKGKKRRNLFRHSAKARSPPQTHTIAVHGVIGKGSDAPWARRRDETVRGPSWPRPEVMSQATPPGVIHRSAEASPRPHPLHVTLTQLAYHRSAAGGSKKKKSKKKRKKYITHIFLRTFSFFAHSSFPSKKSKKKVKREKKT